jgi:hypothetical protein
MIIEMDHHRDVSRLGEHSRKEPFAVGEEENLRVHKVVVSHHAHGHAGAVVVSVREKEGLAVEYLRKDRGVNKEVWKLPLRASENICLEPRCQRRGRG